MNFCGSILHWCVNISDTHRICVYVKKPEKVDAKLAIEVVIGLQLPECEK